MNKRLKYQIECDSADLEVAMRCVAIILHGLADGLWRDRKRMTVLDRTVDIDKSLSGVVSMNVHARLETTEVSDLFARPTGGTGQITAMPAGAVRHSL